jgi:hypothetical protein
MKKKLNNLHKHFSVSQIIKKPMTTRSDLEYLAKKLKIGTEPSEREPLKVVWLKDADPNYKGPQIINLGSEIIGGSHWTCTYDGKYFDSFGLVPPEKLEHLEWTPLQIQGITEGFCGNWCILWLYYAKIGELDRFYNMFEKL